MPDARGSTTSQADARLVGADDNRVGYARELANYGLPAL